jgi:hypothetical protein
LTSSASALSVHLAGLKKFSFSGDVRGCTYVTPKLKVIFLEKLYFKAKLYQRMRT